MPIVMLGEELHPDRAISIEKLYEIFNEYELPYNFPIQDGIENSAFSVVRCENCKYSKMWNTRTGERECKHPKGERYEEILIVNADDFCSSGERDG